MKKKYYKEDGKILVMGGLKISPGAEDLLERLGYEPQPNPYNKMERVFGSIWLKEIHFPLFQHIPGTPRVYGELYCSEKGKKLLECWESL